MQPNALNQRYATVEDLFVNFIAPELQGKLTTTNDTYFLYTPYKNICPTKALIEKGITMHYTPYYMHKNFIDAYNQLDKNILNYIKTYCTISFQATLTDITSEHTFATIYQSMKTNRRLTSLRLFILSCFNFINTNVIALYVLFSDYSNIISSPDFIVDNSNYGTDSTLTMNVGFTKLSDNSLRNTMHITDINKFSIADMINVYKKCVFNDNFDIVYTICKFEGYKVVDNSEVHNNRSLCRLCDIVKIGQFEITTYNNIQNETYEYDEYAVFSSTPELSDVYPLNPYIFEIVSHYTNNFYALPFLISNVEISQMTDDTDVTFVDALPSEIVEDGIFDHVAARFDSDKFRGPTILDSDFTWSNNGTAYEKSADNTESDSTDSDTTGTNGEIPRTNDILNDTIGTNELAMLLSRLSKSLTTAAASTTYTNSYNTSNTITASRNTYTQSVTAGNIHATQLGGGILPVSNLTGSNATYSPAGTVNTYTNGTTSNTTAANVNTGVATNKGVVSANGGFNLGGVAGSFSTAFTNGTSSGQAPNSLLNTGGQSNSGSGVNTMLFENKKDSAALNVGAVSMLQYKAFTQLTGSVKDNITSITSLKYANSLLLLKNMLVGIIPYIDNVYAGTYLSAHTNINPDEYTQYAICFVTPNLNINKRTAIVTLTQNESRITKEITVSLWGTPINLSLKIDKPIAFPKFKIDSKFRNLRWRFKLKPEVLDISISNAVQTDSNMWGFNYLDPSNGSCEPYSLELRKAIIGNGGINVVDISIGNDYIKESYNMNNLIPDTDIFFQTDVRYIDKGNSTLDEQFYIKWDKVTWDEISCKIYFNSYDIELPNILNRIVIRYAYEPIIIDCCVYPTENRDQNGNYLDSDANIINSNIFTPEPSAFESYKNFVDIDISTLVQKETTNVDEILGPTVSVVCDYIYNGNIRELKLTMVSRKYNTDVSGNSDISTWLSYNETSTNNIPELSLTSYGGKNIILSLLSKGGQKLRNKSIDISTNDSKKTYYIAK